MKEKGKFLFFLMNNWEQTAAALDHLGTINYIKQLRIENNFSPGFWKEIYGESHR